MPRDEADATLSRLAGSDIHLGDSVRVTRGRETCPACGSPDLAWDCSDDQTRPREQIHPLVWHQTQWMADSFICRTCDAGWIEPDDPAPITWVRPFWITDA